VNHLRSAVAFLISFQADLHADQIPRDRGPDFGKASPLGLLVIVVLLIATFVLVRSMNRHLNKLPASFDPADPGPDQAVDDGTVGVDEPANPSRSPHEPDS
jgi:hypothetical protein